MDKTCILIVDDNPEIREIINVLLVGKVSKYLKQKMGRRHLHSLSSRIST